ncbi:MAG: hypothetical protein NXH85_13880 [Pseudomonadaceae bacterium]|nr:hypothetical protein [Pseudomonadaceae bacterium]
MEIGTGSKRQTDSDIRPIGTNLPLRFDRYYRSLEGEWRWSYSREVRNLNGLLDVVRDDGRSYRFSVAATSPVLIYEADSDVDFQLTPIVTSPNPVVVDGWTVTTPDDSIEEYDVDGRLTSITNKAGQALTLTYDSNGLSSITDDQNRSLSVVIQSDQLVSVSDPLSNTYSYSYDSSGRLETVTYPDETPLVSNDNPVRTYHYEDSAFPNALTGITDENGDRYATWDYDSSGRVISSEHAGGVDKNTLAFNTNGTVTLTNPLGKQSIFTTQNVQGVERVVSTEGVATALCGATVQSRTYDSNGYVDLETDPEGNVTDHDFDSNGLLLTKTEAVGTPDERVETRTWHSNFRVPTQIVRPGQTIDMTYDAEGRLLTRTTTDTQTQTVPYTTTGTSQTTTYTYNAQGLIATIDGPRTDVTDVTTFTYDTAGDLLSTTNPLGQVTEISSRDARGLPTAIEDVNDVVTELAYNARGWLTTSTIKSAQGDAITTYGYDAVGQVTSITMPDSSTLDYEYDAAHRLTAVENSLGERIEYTLDAAGNQTAEVIRDAGSTIRKSQTRVFDELSRLREIIGGASQSTTYDYDLNNNQTSMTDDNARVTSNVFDALDRLITVTDPAQNDTDYVYDDRDNLVQVTDPRGVVTSYTYDGLDRQIREASADAGTTVNVYNVAGNMTQSTDPRGVVENYAYDALGRVTSITYPAATSENVTYTYDAGTNGLGRLTSMADVSGTTAYAYDDRGNVLTETRTFGGQTYVTSYTYDLADNVLTTTYPSGRVVTLSRDALSRVSSVTTQASGGSVENVASSMSYLPFGGLTGWTYGNGLTATLTYDNDYRLTGIATPTIFDRTIAYDGVSNITAITDNIDSARSQTFVYDALDRLTDATGVYGDIDYGYDAVGNRTSRSIVDGTDTLTETYAYGTSDNRLTSVSRTDNGVASTRTLGYTAGGNTSSDVRHDGTSRTLSYNNRNRLTSVDDGTGNLGVYTLNALGQRVVKVEDGSTTHYHYDRDGQLIAESDDQGVVIREYIFADGLRLAMVAAPTGSGASEIVLDHTSSQFTGLSQWEDLGSGGYTRQRTQNTPAGGIMVDEDQAVLTGSWTTASDNLAINADYLTTPASAGTATATWTINIPAAGNYYAYLTHVASNQNTTAMPITLDLQNGPVTVNVNLRQGGNIWGTNGSALPLAAGNMDVTVESSTGGITTLDAFYLVPTSSSAVHTGTWDLQVPATDTYDVYVKWPSGQANPATQAVYSVDHDGGTAQVAFDQTTNGDQWNLVGSYTFASGTGVVRITAGNNPQRRNLYVGEVRLVPQSSGPAGPPALNFVHSDHLGTPQVISDGSQSVAWDANYKPFGGVTEVTSVINQPLRFPGQVEDGSGSSYNNFRDYDSSLGRYSQSDPIGLDGGLNQFSYVAANPISRTDAFGLSWTPRDTQIRPGDRNATARFVQGQKFGFVASPCVRRCLAEVVGYEEAALAGTAVATGKVVRKPRGGIAGGGPAGPWTSPASKAAAALPTPAARRLGRDGARAAGKAVPYLGWGLALKDSLDFSRCKRECEEEGTCLIGDY